ASAVEYKEKWQVDDDAIKRKKITYDPITCNNIETDDCNGYLEKSINPYCKGLAGNFKPYKSYAYYGSRNDSNVNVNTAIRKNGYLYNFSNYWSFDALNNLVPVNTSSKWICNSEITRINAKGEEVETRDALNRYTFRQYGFNKNMPVAIAQNAGYGEAANEGFEDINYTESINRPIAQVCKKYLDFRGIGGLINTDTSTTLKAHSGSYMLGVSGNSQAIKTFKLISPISNIYNFNFGRDTAKILNVPGGNYSFKSNAGSYYAQDNANFGNSNINVDVYPSAVSLHYYTITCSTYIRIPTQAIYQFSVSLSTLYNNPAPSSYSNTMFIAIYDLDNNLIHSFTASKNISSQFNMVNYSVPLCGGIYKIVSNMDEFYQQSVTPSNTHNTYSWQCTNCQSQDYKSLSTQGGCSSNKPVAVTDSMINPLFGLVPGKRMQFSAWVRENCDSLVCYKPSYLNSHVEFRFPATGVQPVIIRPTGVIIEGWQKVEGEFTVPNNATSADLVFSSDSAQNTYFDDIRIHPFNANMKSYVYDPGSLRLVAELDENNFATFYEYDEEGQIARVKKES
ncbi:MAG: hypothetical protein ABIS01_01425, partial [Ferruginibacter sp.]